MIGSGLSEPLSPLFVGVPGGVELLLLLLVIVVLFGPNKLPQLARSVGKAEVEFQKSRNEVTMELDDLRSPGTTASAATDDPIQDPGADSVKAETSSP